MPDSTYTPAQNRNMRLFCDPVMDSAWGNDTVLGMALNRPVDEDYTLFSTIFGVTVAEAKKTVLGWYPDSGWTGTRIWIVKWKSPLRPALGLRLIVR